MKVGRRAWRVAGVVALGLLSVVPLSAPASANAGYVQLNIGAMSPQYSVNGCRYKILYGNFGSAPFTWVRLYGGCSNVTAGIRSADANGEHWAWSSTVVGTYSDSCGSYTLVQANGPDPGYATGGYILADGTSGSFWKFYDYDGDQTQAPHSLC